MESLRGPEGKALLLKHILPYFESIGFKYQKSRDSNIALYRKKPTGIEEFYINTGFYFPILNFTFQTEKCIEEVEKYADILKEKMGYPDPGRFTVCIFKPKDLHTGKNLELLTPECSNESHVIKNAELFINYCKNYLMPLYDRYDDIYVLDETINGKDIWLLDNGLDKTRPFSMRGFFYKRFIVAILAGRQNLDDLYNTSKINYEKLAVAEGWEGEDLMYDDGWYAVLMDIMKDVKPIERG